MYDLFWRRFLHNRGIGSSIYKTLRAHCPNVRFWLDKKHWCVSSCFFFTWGSIIHGAREQSLWSDNVVLNILDRAIYQVTYYFHLFNILLARGFSMIPVFQQLLTYVLTGTVSKRFRQENIIFIVLFPLHCQLVGEYRQLLTCTLRISKKTVLPPVD